MRKIQVKIPFDFHSKIIIVLMPHGANIYSFFFLKVSQHLICESVKMSARDLEDFIRVIETVERLCTSRTDRTSVVKSPTSSLWSYPTDIYQPSARFVMSGFCVLKAVILS